MPGPYALRRYAGPLAATCTHLDSARILELPDPLPGCEECMKTGDHWVHLRMCLTCGKVGCCDSSPNRHASRHFREEGHPLVRSAEPGETWSWCYADSVIIDPEPAPPSD